jgi:threonine dehydrogenase-like Zn-dependent dehydrogenase
MLGIPSKPVELNFAEDVIFKGATIQGINGRRMYQTWYQMTALLKAGKLDLHPVITDRIAMKDFFQGHGAAENWSGQQDSRVPQRQPLAAESTNNDYRPVD